MEYRFVVRELAPDGPDGAVVNTGEGFVVPMKVAGKKPATIFSLDLFLGSMLAIKPLNNLGMFSLSFDETGRPVAELAGLWLDISVTIEEFYDHLAVTPGMPEEFREAILATREWIVKAYESKEYRLVNYQFAEEEEARKEIAAEWEKVRKEILEDSSLRLAFHERAITSYTRRVMDENPGDPKWKPPVLLAVV